MVSFQKSGLIIVETKFGSLKDKNLSFEAQPRSLEAGPGDWNLGPEVWWLNARGINAWRMGRGA